MFTSMHSTARMRSCEKRKNYSMEKTNTPCNKSATTDECHKLWQKKYLTVQKTIRTSVFLLLLVIGSGTSNAATYYYIGGANNTSTHTLDIFTKANTWSTSSNGAATTVSGGTTNHTYIFDGAGGRTNVVVEFTSGQAYSSFSGQIQVTGNTTVTFWDNHASSPPTITNRTLTFTGSLAGNDLRVDAGSTFYLARRISLSFSGSNTAEINGTLKIGTYNGAATVPGSANITTATITATVINKSLTSNVATLTTSAAHNFIVGQTATISGVDATFNGRYIIASVPTTTTFTFAKTAADVPSTAVSPVGTANSSQLTVNGTLEIIDVGLTGGAFGSNTLAFGVTSKIDFTGTIQNTPTSTNFSALVNNPTGAPVNIYNSGGVLQALTSSFTMNAGCSIIIKNGGILRLHTGDTNNKTFTNNGVLTVEAGGTFEKSNRMNFTQSASPAQYNLNSGGIIRYVYATAGGTAANNIVTAEWPTTLPNGCRIVNAVNQAATVRLALSAAASRTISENSTVEVVGNSQWVNFNNLSYNSTGTTLVYSGSTAKTVDGTVEWPSANGPVNVEINNSGHVTLPASRTIAGTLTLTSGRLILGLNNLTLSNATGLSGGSATSYIETNNTGVLQRTIGAAGTYSFPLGSATAYNPASVVWSAAPGVTRLDARYIASTASTGTGLPLSMGGFTANSLLDNGYWDISVGAGSLSTNFDITLTRNGHNNAGLNLNNHAIIRRDNSGTSWGAAGTWTDPGTTTISPANTGQVSISQTDVSGFGELAMAKGDGGCASPSTQATSFGSNTITATSGNITFTRGNGDGGVLVLARAGSAVDADPALGTSYTASSIFGSGSQIGTGNFVVYNGTAGGISAASGNISISGLSPITTYHFAIYEYNTSGICFNMNELTGSFTTDCSTPVNVTGLTASVDNTQSSITWTNSSCYDEVMIVVKEGTSVTGTPTGDGSAYTANLTFGSGTAFGGGFVAYKGGISPQTISGLVNGTTYYVKVFTRKGSNWSSGEEVSVVPIAYFQAGTTALPLGASQANPFFNSSGTWEDYRVGSWYTQAQFGINGIIELDRIGWFIKQATGSAGNYQNFTIKLKSLSQACDGNFQTGTTTVNSSATVTINSSNPQEAWLEFVLSTPFVWNQGDFLYVETCYDNSSAVGNNEIQVAGFSTSTTGFVRSGGGSGSGCSQSVTSALCSGVHLPSLRIAGTFRYHYRSVQSGNWSSASTWEVSNDGANNWTSTTTAPDNTQNTITIRNGHTVSVSASVTVDEVTVEAGGTLQLNSAVTFTLNNGAGTDLDIVGTFIQSDGILTNNGSIVVKDGGLFRQAKAGTSIPTSTWETGSTCEVTGWTTALGGGINQTFSNFTWNCAGQSTFIALESASMSVSNLFKVESTGSTNQLLVLGNGSTARSLTLGALEISGGHFAVGGGAATAAMAMTVSGDYTQTGGLLDVNRNNSSGSTLNIGGNATISGGSTRIQNNGGSAGIISSLTINGNLTLSGGSLDLDPTSAGTNVGRLFLKGNLTHSSGSLLYTRGATGPVTTGSAGIFFEGTGTQSILLSGGTLSTASGGIGRRFYYKTSSGPTAINETYSHSAAQITVNGSEGSSLPAGYSSWPTSGSVINNVTINNSNGVLMSSSKQVNGTLALDGGTLNIGSMQLTVAGNAVTRITGDIDADAGTVLFGNSTALTLPSGTFSGNVYQLTMNGSGGITLGSPATVSNQLTLTNGILDLNNHNLNVIGGISSGGTSSFIRTSGTGSLIRSISGNGSFTFPVGEPVYSPLTLTLTNGTYSSASVAVYTKDVKVTGLNSNHVAYLNRHWSVEPTGITNPSYSISYTYNYADLVLGGSSEADLVPIKKSGIEWYKPQGALFPDGAQTGTYTIDVNTNLLSWSGLSEFSLFGATINVATPLPIELVSFSAECETDQSHTFQWQTASEHNNDFFTIERSEDGISWSIIATIDGADNSTQLIDYSYSYRPESENIGTIYYYRLKQTDFDGAFEYSGIISPSCDTEYLSYFTNPVQGTTIEGVLVSPVESSALVRVYSPTGQLIGNQELSINIGANLITIPNQQLNQGIYLLRILIDNEVFVHKIMVNN